MRAFIPLVAAAFMALLLPVAVMAEEPVAEAQKVIQQQIDAFLANDAEAAYAFASPAIRQRFPDKDTFFEMVKRGYAPVIRPGNYAFGRSAVAPDDSMLFQELLITGSDGKSWRAIYQMTRDDDGSYKINGVQMDVDTASKGI
ncbi:DUF4864 domain-containing protein [Rhizobium sp. PAMB 3182]